MITKPRRIREPKTAWCRMEQSLFDQVERFVVEYREKTGFVITRSDVIRVAVEKYLQASA